jgi:putative transposase
VLRHQVVLLRRTTKRPCLRRRDLVLLAAASRLLPRGRWSLFLVSPQTLLRWHRELVRRQWTYRHREPGRPRVRSVGNAVRTLAPPADPPVSRVRCRRLLFGRRMPVAGRTGIRA